MDFDVSRLRPSISVQSPQWSILADLCTRYPIRGIEVGDMARNGTIDVVERIGSYTTLWFSRHLFGPMRSMYIDRFGAVGVASLNVRDSRVILTEGVSDFITMKLLYPDRNVLGFTTLGGNRYATKIVLSLFDDITICSDNDMQSAERNTGITNAYRLRTQYERYGRRVHIVLPESGCKDMTEQFLSELRLNFS